MQCDYYDAGLCGSCTLIEQPYDAQLAAKQARVEELLASYALDWLVPVGSPDHGFRNKAKMVVSGTVEEPTIGILDAGLAGVDLRRCRLHTPGLAASLPVLADFVTRAGLVPYDVRARRGELKYLLVTESPDAELMVRFVLRSEEALARIRKHLPWLQERLPGLVVASVNLQPEPKAVLEGEREIVLTPAGALRMRVGGIDLLLRPQSFFQTNTLVAAALYAQARAWVEEVAPATLWDLYCGVGGFALHCSGAKGSGRDVLGVEVSAEAVASARASALSSGSTARFEVGDAAAFVRTPRPAPDLVVVNPPRRGIGPELAAWLEASDVRHVVYSSCNAVSLAADLAAMPSLRPLRGRLMDMFPNTAHHEVIVLLERGSPVDQPIVF